MPLTSRLILETKMDSFNWANGSNIPKAYSENLMFEHLPEVTRDNLNVLTDKEISCFASLLKRCIEEAETRVSRLYAYSGGDIEKAGRELRRINSERDRILAENIELEKRIEGARKLRFDEDRIKHFCNLAK